MFVTRPQFKTTDELVQLWEKKKSLTVHLQLDFVYAHTHTTPALQGNKML